MAFIKHAEHKLLTLSTVNLQRSRRGKKKEEKRRAMRQKQWYDGEMGIKATVLQSI